MPGGMLKLQFDRYIKEYIGQYGNVIINSLIQNITAAAATTPQGTVTVLISTQKESNRNNEICA